MAMSRSLGSTALTSRSPIWISPDDTDSRPAIILSAVVLPHPEGPTSTANSRSWISMLRLSTAITDLNCFTTFFRVTLATWNPFLHNNRLLKNVHLRRCPHPSSLRRTGLHDSLLGISGALYLNVFEEPANRFLSASC